MPILEMQHAVDPAKEILDRAGSDLDNIPICGARILVGMYKRPEKTSGGIILTDKIRNEDIYQGKVGLVLKMGPLPFDDTDKAYFGDRTPEIGDWVAFRPSDGWPFTIGNTKENLECRLLEDRRAVKMILPRPDVIF